MADPPRPGGNVLTQKWGPLPVWAWGLGGGVLVFAIIRYRQSKAASSAAQTLSLPANATTGPQGWGMSGYGFDGGGGGSSGGSSASAPVGSSGTGTSGAGLTGQATPPVYTTPPVSPNSTAAPTVGSSGQPLPGANLQPGDVLLPAPTANNFAGTQATAAAGLGPGQSGIYPNGLRVTRTTLPNGSVSYVYS